MLGFFLTSTALSHLPRIDQHQAPRRTAIQVLANGGVACIAVLISLRWPEARWADVATASLATAAADTWATEIGQRFGGTPCLITNGKAVPPGESGGVTLAGLAAAAAGSLTVAMLDRGYRTGGSIALSGFIGALADSALGATLQARYHCDICSTIGENQQHCDQPGALIHGWQWMTNDTVNALATAFGGLAGALIRGHRPGRDQEGSARLPS
jgi:uncharacterized membrane protein